MQPTCGETCGVNSTSKASYDYASFPMARLCREPSYERFDGCGDALCGGSSHSGCFAHPAHSRWHCSSQLFRLVVLSISEVAVVTNLLEVAGVVSVLWNVPKLLTKSRIHFVIGRLPILP
jgi:hypothetical protein